MQLKTLSRPVFDAQKQQNEMKALKNMVLDFWNETEWNIYFKKNGLIQKVRERFNLQKLIDFMVCMHGEWILFCVELTWSLEVLILN